MLCPELNSRVSTAFESGFGPACPPSSVFARMICGLRGAGMCLFAVSRRALPSPGPTALSLFPAVFELRSEGSVLAHSTPVDQVQGQGSFRVVCCFNNATPPSSFDFFYPPCPPLHFLQPPVPPPPPTPSTPSKSLCYSWISVTSCHAITCQTKGPKTGLFGNTGLEGLEFHWGGVP